MARDGQDRHGAGTHQRHAAASRQGPPGAAGAGSAQDRRPSPLARWGLVVHRHRGWVLTASLLLLVPLGYLFTQEGPFYDYTEPLPTTEAGRAFALIQEQVPATRQPTILLVFTQPGGQWNDSAFQVAVQDALASLRNDTRVASILTPYDLPPAQAANMHSRDGDDLLAIVALALDAQEGAEEYADLRKQVRSDLLQVRATGGLAFGHDFETIFEEDLPRAEAITVPLTLIVLLVVFGAVVAALLPLGVGVLAVSGGMALTGVMAHATTMPDWAVNVVSLIGLGVAIDYSLFIVNRFREELAAGAGRDAALAKAMSTSGHAVVFSGLTVAVSLSGLVFFDGTDFAGVGYAVAAVILLAVLFALTFLPAVLAMLGPRVNRLRIGRRTPGQTSGFWHAIAGAVMRRPWLYLAAVVLLVTVLALPLAQIRFGGITADQFPPEIESRAGIDLLASEFPTQGASEFPVVLRWDAGSPLTEGRIAHLHALSRSVADHPNVASVESLVDLDPTMSLADYQALLTLPRDMWPPDAQRLAATTLGNDLVVLEVHAVTDSAAEASFDLVRDIRALAEPPSAQVLVSGEAAVIVDGTSLIASRIWVALAFIVAATYVLLVIQVRSVLLPLKAVVMNFLSVAASFGVVVWIFQLGHLRWLLDFDPVALDPGNLVLMFCIVFGLSMDYEVLLLSRVHEEYLRTGDNRLAVQQGLERSGRIITGAALIMVFVFGAFGIMRITFMKVIGIGLGFAILFDATIIRALLVPSAMRLMGSWNWRAPAWVRPAHLRPTGQSPSRSAGDLPGDAADARSRAGDRPAAVEPDVPPGLARQHAHRIEYEPVEPPHFSDPKVQAWYERTRERDGKR